MFPSRLLLPALALILQAHAAPPNVIVINCDDLGCGDLGCYGSKVIATPRIGRMAREGVRFTNFHVASSFCSPSRAALLTSRLPARCGVPYVILPSEHTGQPPEEITIAEVLKPCHQTIRKRFTGACPADSWDAKPVVH